MLDYRTKYSYSPDSSEIDYKLSMISSNLGNMMTEKVLKQCFSMMDLTTLKNTDTVDSVSKMVRKVNGMRASYPDFPLPASICVYPNLVSVVAGKRLVPVHATAVAASFPTAQSFPEVKVMEVEMAISAGADEIDIVLPLSSFLAGDYESASSEIKHVRACVDECKKKYKREIILKVILETGVLVSLEKIADASFLAMEAGADFIKTSTGKVDVNATPVAAYVMCECIAAYRSLTERKVGFKAAGGIVTAEDAACYYSIVSCVLGNEWLDKSLFRFGVSRMANHLMSAVLQSTVSYF